MISPVDASSPAPVVESPSAVAAKNQAQPLQAPEPGKLFPEAGVPAQGGVSPILLRTQGASGIAAAFTKYVGPNAVSALVAQLSQKPAVYIAGDQATGKSTLGPEIAVLLGGKPTDADGTGNHLRPTAQKLGIPFVEFVKSVKPEVDTALDYVACEQVISGKSSVYDCRMAGQLGMFLKALGKKNILSVYLTCAPKEQILRYVGRQLGMPARAQLEAIFSVPRRADLATCLAALATLNDPGAKLAYSDFSGSNRDETDRKRLKALYGIDYRDTSVFDLVIDTTDMKPAEVKAALAKAVQDLKARAA